MSNTCISCGVPMSSPADHAPGRPDSDYCIHCSQPNGELQSYDERVERMTQWTMKQDGLDRAAAEAAARSYLSSMPAWRDRA